MRRSLASIALAFLFLFLAGCGKSFDGTGVVISSNPERATITISHDAIDGYMNAMAMPLAVSDGALLEDITRGDRVKFHLVVSPRSSHIDQLSVISAARPDAGLLRSPALPVLTPIGSIVPDFALTDQRGRNVALSQFRDQVVLVTFIYTRCPLPDYCPLLMTNFSTVEKTFPTLIGKDLTLLSITFDPKYDTPDVLARYGEKYGVDGDGWRLLTGAPAAIAQVAETFGIEYWPEEGLFTHTLLTAIIGRQGKLFAVVEGKNHSTAQLADLVRVALVE